MSPRNLLFLTVIAATAHAAGSTTEDELPDFAVAGPAGFGVVSADGTSMLAVHWLLEADFRSFLSDSPEADRDTFVTRFAGLRLDAILARDFHAQLFANFAENRLTVLEAWIEAKLAPWARLRAGKFQFPITEERLTPGTNLPFVSTSPAALLLPARDTGLQLLGTVGGGLFSYNLALVNGAVAAGTGESDADSDKDVVARVFVRPWVSTDFAPLQKLGVGVGASYGDHTGTATSPQLLSLTTYGGQVFFSYAKSAVANGPIGRIAPHLTWGYGPVALYADAVWTRERVSGIDVDSRALSAIGTIVLTGEAAAPLSFVVPSHSYGAFALVLGSGDVSVGLEAFPTLADPTVAMHAMRVYGGGLNWYASRGVAVLTSYGHQVFTAAGGGNDRANEDTLIARLELVL
jgi:Phosphate-selective porin O and P